MPTPPPPPLPHPVYVSVSVPGDGITADTVSRPTSLVILDCGMVEIGDRVLFGPSVSIFAATHETAVQSRRDGVEYARPVRIGDDCWIGGNTTIMPGVTIGKGCTVAAGSVVTRDVPGFSVAMGAPARVVKEVDPVPDLLGEAGSSTAVKGVPEP